MEQNIANRYLATETTPSVSVVLCTYNGAKYIHEQLNSILAQTYPIREIIIQDDRSNDGTIDILQAYASKNNIIKIFVNEKTLGANANFHKALCLATSDYIAISDQDDIWEPEKIAHQIEKIGDAMLCIGRTWNFSDDGSFVYNDIRIPNYNFPRLLFCGVPGHNILMKSDILSLLPPDASIRKVSMYDITYAIIAATHGQLVYTDKVLVHQRRHQDAETYTNFSRSLPSIGNFFYILCWCLRYYRKIKPHSDKYIGARLELLRFLNCDNEISHTAIRMMELHLKPGIWSKLRLGHLYAKNCGRLFQTEGFSLVKYIRGWLYPIMCMYNYRFKLK